MGRGSPREDRGRGRRHEASRRDQCLVSMDRGGLGPRRRLPSGPDSVPQARRVAATALDSAPPVNRAVRGDVLLVVSELVSNAARHGSEPIDLAVDVTPSCVRIEVTDSGDPHPLPVRRVAPTSQSGRGLLIVDSIAESWGVSAEPVGKTVWAEVPVSSTKPTKGFARNLG
jgi:signal transduction histidine kinase